jgi:hypothetical protein
MRPGRPRSQELWIDYFADDVADFGDGRVFQAFAAFIEAFVDFDGGFLHHGVRFLASAEQEEVLAAGETGFAVLVVEGQPEQGGGFAGFVGGSHGCLLSKLGDGPGTTWDAEAPPDGGECRRNARATSLP